MKKLIVLSLVAICMKAQFAKGFNFRNTPGFVTDPANTTYVSADAYPTTRNGVTFGWLPSQPPGPADRSNGVDARLAGINYTNGPANSVFQVDLPATGQYRINLAIGDASFAASGQGAKIYDGSVAGGNLRLTVGPAATATGQFLDAAGTAYSAANWPASNTAATLTFSTSTLLFVLPWADAGFNGSNLVRVAHLFVSQASKPRHRVISQ